MRYGGWYRFTRAAVAKDGRFLVTWVRVIETLGPSRIPGRLFLHNRVSVPTGHARQGPRR